MNKLGIALGLILSLNCGEMAQSKMLQVRVPEVDWLQESADQAADFWAQRNVEVLVLNKSGWVRVEAKDLDEAIGQYQGFARQGTIYIDPDILDNKLLTKCVMVHEMGHALGLPHVEDNPLSLMAPKAQAYDGSDGYDDCVWSVEDERNLCNHIPEACE